MIYRPYIRSERYREIRRRLTAAAESEASRRAREIPLAGGHQGRPHGGSEPNETGPQRYGFENGFSAPHSATSAVSGAKLML